MIPLASPQAQFEAHRAAIQEALNRVLNSGRYVLDEEVERFESAFSRFCGTAYGVGVASGTDAISLSLTALGIGPLDRVVTVSHTAIATVSAVLSVGATPVLVDVDPTSYTMDPNQLEDAMDAAIKAIVPVHLYGRAADMDALCAIAHRWGVPVIEDCAQAVGARVAGRGVGSIGTMGCFSFYPTKNLGALGDAGMVVSDDKELTVRVQRLRQYGWDSDRVSDRPGVNSRLDEMQAAVLSAKLPLLDADNQRRIEIARRYSEAFAALGLEAPPVMPEGTHVYHLYVVEVEGRDRMMSALAKRGVQTSIHYPRPAHREPGYVDKVEVAEGGLAKTDRLVKRILSLPLFPELTDDQVDAVIEAVTESHKEAH